MHKGVCQKNCEETKPLERTRYVLHQTSNKYPFYNVAVRDRTDLDKRADGVISAVVSEDGIGAGAIRNCTGAMDDFGSASSSVLGAADDANLAADEEATYPLCGLQREKEATVSS
ncbi:hypothetical protein D915_009719 [Fasciola hepatica]|uniref:Uncharacterized protein n=1 Tax=Fasciola hepatica TaxID=6192 RepID=A0A4E0R0W0_FASHE|nr:hypothetical protein D915_009719 [Fasciola hepatica]